MGRTKQRNWRRVTLSLGEESDKKIDEMAKFEGMNKSEFIEFLGENWSTGFSPTERIQKLNLQREELKTQMNDIDAKINEATRQLAQIEEWNKIKKTKKAEAIRIISRRILDREFEEAENVARIWQRMTGVPAMELLLEAKQKVEKSGI